MAERKAGCSEMDLVPQETMVSSSLGTEALNFS